MISSSSLLRKIDKVFLFQLILISFVLLVGVYTATSIVENVLIKKALEQEARHFWSIYDINKKQLTPNIDNLKGYIAKKNEFSQIPDELKHLDPGYRRVAFHNNNPLVYVEDRFNDRLFLVFEENTVKMLSLYFGIVPLLLILFVMYICFWFTYKIFKKSVSPIVELATILNQLEHYDKEYNDKKISGLYNHESNDEVLILIDAVNVFRIRIGELINRERQFSYDVSKTLNKPLSFIDQTAQELKKSKIISRPQQINIERILSACDEMNLIIETLFLFVKDDVNSDIELVNINSIIEKIIRQTEIPYNKDSYIKFVVTSKHNLFLKAQYHASEIVLGNLIRNASQYSQKSTIHITIYKHCVLVKEGELDIVEEETPKPVEPHLRSKNTENISGFGLGIDIVNQLCHRFNWQLDILKSESHGNSVTLFFNTVKDQTYITKYSHHT